MPKAEQAPDTLPKTNESERAENFFCIFKLKAIILKGFNSKSGKIMDLILESTVNHANSM